MWKSALRAIRANSLPGIILWAVAAAIVAFYYLAAGRIDFMTCERYNGLHLLKTVYPEEAKKIQALYPVISYIAFYLMFAKAAPDTAAKLAAFARGLAHLKSTGRYAELLRLYGYAPEAAAAR